MPAAPAPGAPRRLLGSGLGLGSGGVARTLAQAQDAAAGEDGNGARRRRRRLMQEGEGAPPPPPAGGSGGEGGEGGASAAAGAADGCFPDFQTWTDFDWWLDGKLVGARTAQTSWCKGHSRSVSFQRKTGTSGWTLPRNRVDPIS